MLKEDNDATDSTLLRYRGRTCTISRQLCLSYLTDRTGMKLSQDMLGSDQPERIEALYNDLDEWLCGNI